MIGLPGDTIDVRDGQVVVNGKALSEPYVYPGSRPVPADRGTAGSDRVDGRAG